MSDIEGANRLLSNGFVNHFNEKFAKAASSDEDAHVPLSPHDDIDPLLCWEYERQLSRDWVVRFENKHYQIEGSNAKKVQAKQRIQVRRHLDESISLWSKNEQLTYKVIEGKPAKEKVRRDRLTVSQQSEHARKNKHKTPWGRFNPDWLKAKQSRHTSNL